MSGIAGYRKTLGTGRRSWYVVGDWGFALTALTAWRLVPSCRLQRVRHGNVPHASRFVYLIAIVGSVGVQQDHFGDQWFLFAVGNFPNYSKSDSTICKAFHQALGNNTP